MGGVCKQRPMAVLAKGLSRWSEYSFGKKHFGKQEKDIIFFSE